MGNFCCVDFKTNCKYAITMGYLKTLVDGRVPINTSIKPDFANDDYCPTYYDLTSGALIQQYVDAGPDHWSENIDGIEVNGVYDNDSVVNKEDVVFYFTTIGEFEIMAGQTTFSECGDSTMFNYTCGFSKVVKRINSDCEIIVSTVHGSDTGLTPTYTSSQSWATVSGNRVTAPKNGTISAQTRTTNITATVVVRGVSHTSNSVTITQRALTGAYEQNGVKTLTSFTFTGTPNPNVVGCEGGTIRMDYTIEVTERRYWVDSCGVKSSTKYIDTVDTITGFESDSFSRVECPESGPVVPYTEQKTLSYTYSGVTKAITFTQDCIPTDCCDETGYTCTTECGNSTITVDKCGYNNAFIVDVYEYCADPEDLDHKTIYNDYVVTWEYVGGTGDFITFGGTKNLSWYAPKNCDGVARTAQYIRHIKTADLSTTIQDCTYTFSQVGERCETCECDCDVLSFDKALNYYNNANKIVRDGIVFDYTYSFTECGGDKNVTFSKANPSDTWYTLNNDTTSNPTKLTVSVSENTGTIRSASINIAVNGDTCDKIITFSQQEGCTCSNASENILTTIPRTGMTSNTPLGSYSITNDCNSKISYTSSDLSISASNGAITLLSAIPENSNEDSNTFHITKNVNGTSACTTFTITQPGLACNCEDMTVTLSIPQTGVSANEQIGTYTVANADCLENASFSSTDLAITYSNGVIRTTNAIPANTGENEHI